MVSAALKGVFRSLRIYHGPEAPRDAMDLLYRDFVSAGDLVFDIGAHVGDRVSSFRRLGARVVAIEPQPLPLRAIWHIHGADADVEIVAAAVAAHSGELEIIVNTDNPTVSTASHDFIGKARGAEGWHGQTWDDRITVNVLTLDELIEIFGHPRFVKIDVEGFEDVVLEGLSEPLPGLSFEFTTIARDVAMRAIARLSSLGEYAFDVSLGETHQLTFGDWVSPERIAEHLTNLPHTANSGDVYARLVIPPY